MAVQDFRWANFKLFISGSSGQQQDGRQGCTLPVGVRLPDSIAHRATGSTRWRGRGWAASPTGNQHAQVIALSGHQEIEPSRTWGFRWDLILPEGGREHRYRFLSRAVGTSFMVDAPEPRCVAAHCAWPRATIKRHTTQHYGGSHPDLAEAIKWKVEATSQGLPTITHGRRIQISSSACH